jgi:hypothetical protein
VSTLIIIVESTFQSDGLWQEHQLKRSMYHFASSYTTSGSSGQGTKSTLNATQQKSSSDPFFLKIEEELHDARRVQSHGQEDDLRLALDMVISRVSELVRGHTSFGSTRD